GLLLELDRASLTDLRLGKLAELDRRRVLLERRLELVVVRLDVELEALEGVGVRLDVDVGSEALRLDVERGRVDRALRDVRDVELRGRPKVDVAAIEIHAAAPRFEEVTLLD